MLEIHSNYPPEFNGYLLKKIKADLRKSAFFFNPTFLFRNKEYTLDQCIDSLFCYRRKIYFKLEMPVRHLIYNNRQLFWLNIIELYKISLDKEYLSWKGYMQNKKTMSRKR